MNLKLIVAAFGGILVVSLGACSSSDSSSDWKFEEPRQVAGFCKSNRPTVEPEFRKVGEGRWERRLGEFRSGCGVYHASMAIDISADDMRSWTYTFDYDICNACDKPMSLRTVQLGVEGGAADGHKEVESFFRSGSRPLFALVDYKEDRYVSGCSRLAMAPTSASSPVVIEFVLQPDESVSDQHQMPLYSLDHDINGIQGEHMPYWESPLDYTSPLSGELWWGKLQQSSSSSKTVNAAHLPAACHEIGFPVLDPFDTDTVSAFAIQRIDPLSIPGEVTESLPELIEEF
jgi:hypothetical protein